MEMDIFFGWGRKPVVRLRTTRTCTWTSTSTFIHSFIHSVYLTLLHPRTYVATDASINKATSDLDRSVLSIVPAVSSLAILAMVLVLLLLRL